MANNIVHYRDQNGPFKQRKELLKVPRLGEKTFVQCAGFLRIAGGDEPLDASAVHPESYPVVERIVAAAGCPITGLIGNSSTLRKLFVDAQFGLPTVRDILQELEKPGRDPRPEFKAARFADGVEDIKDLREGMILEGVVSNVAAFGAFVDIGVHQDGLIHISALSDTFVKDPRDVVKAGDIVNVKVLEVDVARKRIALTRRLDDNTVPVQKENPAKSRQEKPSSKGQNKANKLKPKSIQPDKVPAHNALAQAFARALSK